MASPAIVTSATSTSSGTSHTVSLPADISAGDLLICFFGSDGDDPVTSFPVGWTQVGLKDAEKSSIEPWWREADGSEGSTIAVTTTASEATAHVTYHITGAEDPDTQAPEMSVGAHGFSDAPDPDSLSPTGGSKDYLWFAVCTVDGNHNGPDTAPTNYSNLTQASEGGASGHSTTVADRAVTATSEDPGTFTGGNEDDWCAITVAVHPPASGGTTYDETGLQVVVTSTVDDIDALVLSEDPSFSVVSTVDVTDAATYIETVLVSVTSTVDGSDVRVLTETARDFTVVSTVDGAGNLYWLEATDITIVSTITETDTAIFIQDVNVTVTSTVTATDSLLLTETASFTITSTVDETDTLTGVIDETGRNVTVTATVTLDAEQLTLTETPTVTVTSTVTETDTAIFVEPDRLVTIVATVTILDAIKLIHPAGPVIAVLVPASSVADLTDQGFAQALSVLSDSESVLVDSGSEADVVDAGFAIAPVDQSKTTV